MSSLHILNNYENTLQSIIQFMFNNSIFNTYITHIDNDSELSIILKTSNPKLNDLLNHLNHYSKIKDNDSILNDTCCICFDEYKTNQYKRILDKCNHCFHKKCIDKWFRKNQSNMNCPICRTNYNKNINLL